MPRAASVRLNRALTSRKAQMSRTHFLPNIDAINAETEDADELIDAMMETLLYGQRHAITGEAPDPDPELQEQFPHVFSPTPGRQLWGWSHLHNLADHRDVKVMEAMALKPSQVAITPLHAYTSVPDNQTALRKLVIHLGGAVDYNQIRAYLRWQDFGHPYNEAYFTTDHHHLPYEVPTNSRRTPAQNYALHLDPSGHLPIQSILIQHPPVYQVMHDKLEQAYGQAKLTLNDGPNRPHVKATHAMMQANPTLPPKVARLVLGLHGYNGPIPWNRLYDLDISSTEHAELIIARQVVQQLHHSYAFNPYITLAISLLSGVSPASMALAAIDRIKRTGLTFLSEGDILKMGDIISVFDPPRGAAQQEQREDLSLQLEELAAEMAMAQDSLGPHLSEEIYDMTTQKDTLAVWGKV